MEVAPGVRWLRMALPFALDHINLWLLRDEIEGREGWTVVDCCITHDDPSAAMGNQVLRHELEGLPILRVIVTHMHPDHIGLAHWLCERWNAPLWISATDYNAARLGTQVHHRLWRRGGGRFLCVARPDRPGVHRQNPRARRYYPFSAWCRSVPRSFRRMMDGQVCASAGGLAVHCRLRPCAGAHGAVLRRIGPADQRRHDAAAHLHQRERV
jgi:hypothetical protein